MDIIVPEELQERYISPDLKCELYFDKYQNYVKAEVFLSREFNVREFNIPLPLNLVISDSV